MKRRFNPMVFLIYGVMLLMMVFLINGINRAQQENEVSYAQMLDLFAKEEVRWFSLDSDGLLTLELRSESANQSVELRIGDTEQFHRDLDTLIEAQKASGVLEDYDLQPAPEKTDWFTILPYVLLGFGAIYVMVMLMGRANGGQNGMARFTKANARLAVS